MDLIKHKNYVNLLEFWVKNRPEKFSAIKQDTNIHKFFVFLFNILNNLDINTCSLLVKREVRPIYESKEAEEEADKLFIKEQEALLANASQPGGCLYKI